MLKTCPPPVDVQDIQFKLRCRLKVFNNTEVETLPVYCNLVSCASRYGLIFIGSNMPNLEVIQAKCLENYSPKDKDITNYQRRNISLSSAPIHICVNCDSTILAVVLEKDKCPTVIFYDVLSFYKQNVSILAEARLSATPGVLVREVNWNPALPTIFTACKSNGTLGIYEVKGNSIDINELPPAAEATCFCWSPKGKQIAVGSKNGRITQYKPDLKAVRVVNEPPLEGQHSIIALQWVSNYQFIGIYQLDDSQAKLIVIDAPKTGDNTYTNYDDICYSGSDRNAQFYMILQQHWNLLMVASSNSTELGVLGLSSESTPTWTQLILPDSARAELPLGVDRCETYPVGLAFDISATQPLLWGEGTIPPCPYLLFLSHRGLLCAFDSVNLKQNAISVCAPPDPVADQSGFANFLVEGPSSVVKEEEGPSRSTPTFSFSSAQTTTTDSKPVSFGIVNSSFGQRAPFSMPQVMSNFSTQPFTLGTTETVPKSEQSLPETAPLGFNTPVTNSIKPLAFAIQVPATTSVKQLDLTTPASQKPAAFSITSPSPNFSFSEAVSTTVATTAINKPNENQSLFGKQISLTPVKLPQPSTSLFGQSVISPINKEQSSSVLTASDKYSSIFASLNSPATSSAIQTKHIIVAKPKSKTTTTVQPKMEIKPTVKENLMRDTESVLAKMIREECLCMESELNALIQRGRELNVNIGSEIEKEEMVREIEGLQEFIEEIVDVSLGESAEVHTLKQNLILSWAWYEEALSNYNISRDETVTQLLKCRPLDSVSEKRQTDIIRSMYYLETQLSQAHRALDELWDKFQDFTKRTHRMQMPTMEAIYQTIIRQSAVLQKQNYILKDIANHLKCKTRLLNGPPLLVSIENTSELEKSLRRLQLDPENMLQHFHEKVMKRAHSLSKEKSEQLRSILKNREVPHVTTINRPLSSSLHQTSFKNKLESILGAQMSPVSKSISAKDLQFTQSTPIKHKDQIDVVSPPPNTPAQTEPQKIFTFKKLERSPSANFATGFQSLTKVTSTLNTSMQSAPLSFNKPSAFAPTAGAKVFNFQAVSTSVPTPFAAPNTFFFGSSLKPAPQSDVNVDSQLPWGSNSAVTDTPVSLFKKPDASICVPFTESTSSSKLLNVRDSEANKSVETSIKSSASDKFVNPTPTTFGFGIKTKTIADTAVITKPSTGSTSVTTVTPISTFSTLNFTQSVSSSTSKPIVTFSTGDKKSGIFTIPITISAPVSSGANIVATSIATISSVPSATALPKFGIPSTSIPASPTTVSSITFTTSNSITSSTVSISNITSSGSIFGKPTNTASSLFNSAITTTAKTVLETGCTTVFNAVVKDSEPGTFTGRSIFGSNILTTSPSTVPNRDISVTNSTSVFTTSITTSIAVSATNSTPIFGSPASVAITTTSFFNLASGFGSPIVSTTSTSISTTTSIFGSPTATLVTSATTSKTKPSIFESGITCTSSFVFATTATTTSLFSANTTTTNSVATPISSTTTQAFNASIFSADSTSSVPSLFAPPTATGLAVSSTSKTVEPAQASLFGNNSSTTQTSIFGAATPTLGGTSQISSSGSIFGSSPATTQTSIFGGSGSLFNVPSQAGGFGLNNVTTTSSIFGQSTTSTSVFASDFGTTTTATPFRQSSSLFETAKTTEGSFGSAFGSSNVFGSASATAAPVFGQSVTFGNSSSVFSTSTSSSVFGSTTTGSTFAANSTENAFATPASTSFSFATAAGNPGGTTTFGFGGLNMGNTATTNSDIFGGNTSFISPNPFNRTDQKPAFGGGSIFGNPTTTSSSIFGSSTGSTFGAPSGFGQQSIFAQQPTFGQSSFGQSSFGSTQPGPFSSGAGVAQSGFGSPGFQKPPSSPGSAFGAAPVFGGSPKPAFGAAATFGGAPAFGSAGGFGSSPTGGKVFGASAPAGTFGGSNTPSPGFGNLANQNSVGFGNLAQQAATSTSTAFSGNSSFSNWR